MAPMPSPQPCDFCIMGVATTTVTRTAGEHRVVLRLCGRCAALQQYVIHVSLLEANAGGHVCMICGARAQGHAVVHDSQGQFLGRYAVCQSCPGRRDLDATQFLRRATPWTPGVIELPPPPQRAEFSSLLHPPSHPSEEPLHPPHSVTEPAPAPPPPPPHPPANDATARRNHEIEELTRAMNEAVRVEDYQRAATLRDRIRALQD